MLIRPAAGARWHALALIGMVLLAAVAGHAQTVIRAGWFQVGTPEIDKQANGAVQMLTSGMSDILLALDAGRKQGAPVDAELAKKAIGELRGASDGFGDLTDRVKGHSIDEPTIIKYGVQVRYEDLLADLRKNGYTAPSDWNSYILLLQHIVLKVVGDLQAVENSRNGAATIEQAFLDLISQKILLEKIGALSGIITVAMQ